jgi:uncharacterized protein YbjQ (UPF0145 family)
MEYLFGLAVLVVLLVAGGVVGSANEAAHFRRLDAEEQELAHILMSDMKRLPDNWQATDMRLVTGDVVIATDYFKVFVAGLRNLFGGRIRGYEKLMERARREAVVRMLRQAQAAGANAVWNVRLATSTIQGKQQGKSAGVEVMAYGTAFRVAGE